MNENSFKTIKVGHGLMGNIEKSKGYGEMFDNVTDIDLLTRFLLLYLLKGVIFHACKLFL